MKIAIKMQNNRLIRNTNFIRNFKGGMTLLAAVKGIVKGNTVVIDDEDIRDYDGAEVIVTLLNYPQRKAKKVPVDWDSFVIPSERGLHVDEYMKEMRENDRL